MSAIGSAAFLGGSPGGGEILVVFLALLLLFGAKRLPETARSLGKALAELRRAAREVSDEILRADVKEKTGPQGTPEKTPGHEDEPFG